MAPPKIFVSHSHQDNTYCREFVAALRQKLASNDAVWYDEHNLGWGALRAAIERELSQRQHFVAILSPTAVASDWVNAEIDAALDLVKDGSMQTIQFVIAAPCTLPLLLRRYKRIEQPDGTSYLPAEAAARALITITSESPQSTTPTVQQPATPQAAPILPEHFPQWLAGLGFVGKTSIVDGKVIEYIVPPVCDVPAGPFLMGDDKHSVTLSFYRIARYPVTVAEYACFVRAGHAQPEVPRNSEGNKQNWDWEQQLAKPDHPVVWVTWDDVASYSAWLSQLTGQPWGLPTEEEWEKAARGTDGREYSWGDNFDKTRCNTQESGIRGTTPVWKYPSGAGPYGTQDQIGNVWEWTMSYVDPSSDERWKRGGDWSDTAEYARAAFRGNYWPISPYLGFRLVMAAPTGS